MSAPQTLTRNQSLVLDALADAEGPVSAYGLLDLLRGDGLRAPLQVYRALEKLTELGLVHRLESLNAFVACAHRHTHDGAEGPVAFAICENCGRVEEFSDPVVEERLAQWASAHGFSAGRTTIEIRGKCEACGRA